jgi:hypothetical protein
MTILIQSSKDARREFEVEQELQRAFTTLHAAFIKARGGGRFMDGSGYIVLAREADGPAALAALAQAGINALVSELGYRRSRDVTESCPRSRRGRSTTNRR